MVLCVFVACSETTTVVCTSFKFRRAVFCQVINKTNRSFPFESTYWSLYCIIIDLMMKLTKSIQIQHGRHVFIKTRGTQRLFFILDWLRKRCSIIWFTYLKSLSLPDRTSDSCLLTNGLFLTAAYRHSGKKIQVIHKGIPLDGRMCFSAKQ